MNREEQLDYLIDRRQQEQVQAAEVTNELHVRLAAAEMLIPYQKMEVPPAVAQGIEQSMRKHIQRQTQITAPVHFPASPQLLKSPRRKRRLFMPFLSAAILLILLGMGAFTAMVHALPGDPLYGARQKGDQFVLIFAASPSDRAKETISQLQGALTDLETVVGDGRSSDAVQQALQTVIIQTKTAQAAVAALATGSVRASVEPDLMNALRSENQTLRALLNNVNWSTRLAFTQQLGVIGQSVPMIKQVSISQQSNDTLIVTITGAHFAPQARLVIDGQSRGTTSQQTLTELVETISQEDWQSDTALIGVLNPDGTAVQVQVVFHENKDQQPEDGDGHGGKSGSGSGSGSSGSHDSTPSPGDEHGGSGKGGSGGKGSDG